MRHNTAAQKGDGGGWHYASMSNRGGYPLGYCDDHEPHATADEARECYGQWRRDHIQLDGKSSNWMDCRVCGAATKSSVRVAGDGYSFAPLCDEHLTTEHAIQALGLEGPAGDSWES
jgi:hypothetical protein